jgi:hypothetical protein
LAIDLQYTPAVGATFLIIDNDGTDAVSGTFASLPEGMVFAVTNGAKLGDIPNQRPGELGQRCRAMTAIDAAAPVAVGNAGERQFSNQPERGESRKRGSTAT